jgi:hypothetical protein
MPDGDVVIGDVSFPDSSTAVVKFTKPLSGTAQVV